VVTDAFAFHCSACGRCCNSPPALTLDELLHHADRFVGCLAVRRDAGGALALQTQGHDYPSIGACPARDAAGLCGVHDDHKPGMCQVVPLDPREPQARQVVVLRRRHAESAFLAADCLAPGARAGFAPLVEGERIVDQDYLAAFERQRAALQIDDERWGRDVLAWMRPELARLGQGLPPGGYLALSLVPVLAGLARASAQAHARCIAYARRQVALIDANVARAIQRRHAADRAFTEELRRFAAQYARFADAPARAAA
jgi:hypothetical protein